MKKAACQSLADHWKMTVINSQLLHTADGGRSEGDNETNSISVKQEPKIYILLY